MQQATMFSSHQGLTILDSPRDRRLREAVASYGLDVKKLRELVAMGANLRAALNDPDAPEEITSLITILQTLVTPTAREQIKSPTDAAAFLMVTMSHRDQEQLWVLCLNTKNRIQHAQAIYQGTVNSAQIRPAEVFRPAMQLNSPAILIAHCHPSGDATPSPEDVLITRELLSAGKILEIDLLDHLVIGQGSWVSMRERQLGFSA
jgi:hypothetical protein